MNVTVAARPPGRFHAPVAVAAGRCGLASDVSLPFVWLGHGSGTGLTRFLPARTLFATEAAGERLHSVRVCHSPYRIHPAEVTQWSDAALRLAGLAAPGCGPEHVCATEPQEVEIFAPERVE